MKAGGGVGWSSYLILTGFFFLKFSLTLACVTLLYIDYTNMDVQCLFYKKYLMHIRLEKAKPVRPPIPL